MSKPPRISVLLPARNAGATLAAALRSVQRQTEARFECVVVDDGSEDDTARLARSFAERDRRFRVVATHEGGPVPTPSGGRIASPRGGLVAALNRGVGECRASLVARMDADDLMHRDRLAMQADYLDAHPELDAVGCHVRLFPRAELGEGMRRYERWLNGLRCADDVRREAFVECPVAHPSLVIRRRRLEALRYREAGWPEDYDLVLRLLESGPRVGVLPERLLLWRESSGRLSRRDPRYALDRFTACKAAFLARGLLAGSRTYVLWGYGHTGRALRRALLRHGREPSHVVELHPGRLGNRIHGAPVVPPSALAELRPRAIVVSVAGADARGEIRAALAELGLIEGRQFICAA